MSAEWTGTATDQIATLGPLTLHASERCDDDADGDLYVYFLAWVSSSCPVQQAAIWSSPGSWVNYNSMDGAKKAAEALAAKVLR